MSCRRAGYRFHQRIVARAWAPRAALKRAARSNIRPGGGDPRPRGPGTVAGHGLASRRTKGSAPERLRSKDERPGADQPNPRRPEDRRSTSSIPEHPSVQGPCNPFRSRPLLRRQPSDSRRTGSRKHCATLRLTRPVRSGRPRDTVRFARTQQTAGSAPERSTISRTRAPGAGQPKPQDRS